MQQAPWKLYTFTKRAFENNKLDLSQAEAIADLVNAETEMQRKQAYKELEGEVSSITKNIYNEDICLTDL